MRSVAPSSLSSIGSFCRRRCNEGVLTQRFPVDLVEGPVSGSFDSTGQLTWSGGGDRLTFDFPASPNERFLVVNETWDKGWSAQIDGQHAELGTLEQRRERARRFRAELQRAQRNLRL